MPRLPDRSIAVVLGTRPEMIKLSVLITLLGDAARVIHTGQHFDNELAFGRGQAHRRLDVGGRHRGEQIGEATSQLTRDWGADPPAVVIVQGDTNTALAGALAANAVEIPLIHVEAGLRSHDRAMPEEHNRILIDHLADVCCAATPGNVTNLWAEGIPEHRIILTGNPIVEAVHLTTRDHASAHRATASLTGPRFVLATVHRPENTDDPDRLRRLLEALGTLDLPVLLPLHPRTRQRVRQFGLGYLLERLHVTGPLTYPAFLAIAEQATLLISDSGGLQEESSVLGLPLLVIRRSTERPEALSPRCLLVPDPGHLAQHAEELITNSLTEAPVTCPFGDGRASARIADLSELIGLQRRHHSGYATTHIGDVQEDVVVV
ncbi:UDP-N-acetylglucosamine 2-epimerase (non-hydrolyzing) [Acrocarpospora sp. B8E8]|uniref:non-hydrolyzing UDP-N-acetylglucosamine 2-epimerase n=1 Tax=Acrocarpospora sp. B8E8 TaxID=3153572 RepID=UPI00325C3EC9